MRVRTCLSCRERFIGESIYCSDRCKAEHQRIKAHAQEILKRSPKKKKIKSELARINEEARENHMSYGQYVALREMTGRR